MPTGIDRVALAYLQRYEMYSGALVHQRPITAYLGKAPSRALFKALLSPLNDAAPTPPAFKVWSGRAALAGLPLWLSRPARPRPGELLVHLTHSDLDDAHYVASWQRRGLKPIVMVHDLIPITHPGYCREGEAARHAARMRHVLAHASGIVCNSPDTLRELARFATRQRLPMPPAIAAPLGTRRLALSAASGPLPMGMPPKRAVFLMLGTIEPRKNHALVLDVWRRLAARHGADTPLLVLAGRQGWDVGPLIAALDGDAALAPHVRRLGACSDAELATWMAQARALLLPSWTEGYGMPLTEALQAGLPVLASDIAVFRDTAGAIPDYAAPDRPEDWLRLVDAYAAPQSPARAAQLARLAGYRAPSWDAHFATVDAFMNEIRHAAR